MSITKKATLTLANVQPLEGPRSTNGMEKTAAARLKVDANSEAKKVVDAEIAKHPTALFFRARAIVADETNSNGDYFSSSELEKSAQSFVGVPFYTNHENTDITKAKGKIVFSEWEPKEKAIYVIGFIDREAYPQLCRGVEQDYMRGVSMGAINGSSMILMSDGTEKPICDVKSGEVVMSPYGRPCRVAKTHSAFLGTQMYRLKVESNHRCPLFTHDHPIMVIDGDDIEAEKRKSMLESNRNYHARMASKTSEIIGWGGWRKATYRKQFKQASEINVGDYIVIPSKFVVKDDGKNAPDDFFYAAGAYLGDGYVACKPNRVERVTFCLGMSDTRINQRIAQAVENVSGKKPVHVNIAARNGLYLSVYDNNYGTKLVNMFGTGAAHKRIPVQTLTMSQAKSLICGYLDTDGCIVKRTVDGKFGGFHISSKNIGLLEDTRSLLIAMGVPSAIRSVSRTPSPNSVVRTPTIEHTLDIGANGLEVFSWSEKVKNYNPPPSLFGGGNTFVTSVGDTMGMACRVKSVDCFPFNETVYDLTVENDESYVANGVAVHNCTVEYSECSICRNKAATTEEYCPHVKYSKGRKFTGQAKNTKTGEVQTFKNAPVYEINYGVRFIELSGVGDPACKSCRIQGVYDNDENMSKAASRELHSSIGGGRSFLAKVASVENSLLMYKDTNLYKQASQQELQQIEQVLQTLEQISVSLIKNRKRVEVEFASDLVKILSELQEFADELTGAGYGQLQGDVGEAAIPGLDAGDASQAPVPMPGPAEGVVAAPGGTAVSDISGLAEATPAVESTDGVGTISGSPSQPAVSLPKMPTAPKKPMASNQDKFTRIAELIGAIHTTLNQQTDECQTNGGEINMNRRTPNVASIERASIKHALSDSMKETAAASENVLNHGDIKVIGGSHMSDAIGKTAARGEAPSTLTENQLDANLKNHPRTDAVPNDTIGVQVQSCHTDGEPQKTTEDQLVGTRQGDAPRTLPEKQLEGKRKGAEPTDTLNVQLEGNRSNSEANRLTESQLADKSSDLYSRAAFHRQQVKTAEDHASTVIRALAESAVRCSATPNMMRQIVASLVEDTKSRTETLDFITSSGATVGQANLVVARARYWGGKGVTLASVTHEDMKADVVGGLRTLVARDEEISPEAIMDVLDVVGAEDESTSALSTAIDEVLDQPAETATISAASARKQQIRTAVLEQAKIEKMDAPPEVTPVPLNPKKNVEEREKERSKMKDALASKRPTHIIEATVAEIGTSLDELRNNKPAARKKIIAFVNKIAKAGELTVEENKVGNDGKMMLVASKVNGLKVANITNVTVDGAAGSVQIAIQTEEGDTTADVSLDLADQGNDVAGAPVEGDATGDGLDALMGAANAADAGAAAGAAGAAAPATGTGTPPVAPAPNAPLPTASTKRSVKTAQFGGAAGGLPGGGALGGAQDPGSAVPQGMPAMDAGGGLQNFTEDENTEEDEKAPGVGEQMMPGSICPFCHGSDTTTGKKDLPPGAFECNSCGAKYEVHVNVEVLNPEGMSFEEGSPSKEVSEPKLPSMPVSAVTKLDKAGLEKIASCEQKYGHVCPACGMTECKPLEKGSGVVSYVCPSCETKTTKEVLVASDKTGFMQIAWTLNPKKVFSADCKVCKQAALEYMATMKVASRMHKAAEANNKPETAFPSANCAEYITRRFGGNAVATNGPCKGQPLSDCVCKQLAAFGLRQRRDVEKLASVYTKPDLLEQCVGIWKEKGYKQAQAETMCKAMRKKYAKEAETNEWLEAFAGDSRFTTEELRIMKEKSNAIMRGAQNTFAAPENLDADLGAPLDDVAPAEPVAPVSPVADEETVTVEIPEDIAREIADQVEEQTEENAANPADKLPEEITPPEEMAPADAVASTGKNVKTAAKPTKVEDISSGVEGKVKGGTGTIGKEKPFDAAKPSIPSNESSSKIGGEKDTIPEATLPDIPADSATMGDEANTLKGTPPVSTEIRGRVAGTQSSTISREAAKPTKVEDISSGVEGKVKGTGTIVDKPSIPSNEGKSKIGGENETIPDASLPDIPSDNDLIGGEKETQKGMPAINTDIRGRVLAEKRDQQVAKIAAARHKKACQVAAKLMGLGRIAEADYEAVVEDLSKIEVDRMEAFAERLYKSVKVASDNRATVLSTPIVQEASAYKPEMPKTLADQLKGIFTIGNDQVNQRAMEDDSRDATV